MNLTWGNSCNILRSKMLKEKGTSLKEEEKNKKTKRTHKILTWQIWDLAV